MQVNLTTWLLAEYFCDKNAQNFDIKLSIKQTVKSIDSIQILAGVPSYTKENSDKVCC